MTEISQKDRLWQRVRTMLGRRAEVLGHGAGLGTAGRLVPVGRPVEEELHRSWMIAAANSVPLCVMALEIDCFAEYLLAYGQDMAEDCVERLERAVLPLLRHEEDRCLRLGRGGLLLVLPAAEMAAGRDLANRIGRAVRHLGLSNKESHAGTVTVGAGLAVVNPEPPFDRSVLDMAKEALRKAQRRGLGRIEIVDLRMAEERGRQAA